jgi:hypothetical protein
VIHALFDPGAGKLPLPNDVLRDAEAGHLALPAPAADAPAAEAAFVAALNRMDAWPAGMPARLEFSGALDPARIGPQAIRVFELLPEGIAQASLPSVGLPADAPTQVVIPAPEGGWTPGRTYLVAALGGQVGLRGAAGEAVVADAAFYFLRLKEDLREHAGALPGATPEEKAANAARLEALRQDLAPYFEHLEALGLPRDTVVSLWRFTVSERVTVVMDAEAGGACPCPPTSSGIPPRAWSGSPSPPTTRPPSSPSRPPSTSSAASASARA